MKKKVIYIILSIILVISIPLIVTKTKKKSSSDDTISQPVTHYGYNGSLEDFNIWDFVPGLTTETIDASEIISLPNSYDITLELINQYPELPTGCESVSLTMLLNYYGFGLDKETIASEYLIYSDKNFVIGFVGNPFTANGYGAYAPCMTDTANAFLKAQNAALVAHDITGTDIDRLFELISNDTPVLVWTTINQADCIKSDDKFYHNGIWYSWVKQEHCVVLSGYNLSANTVTIYDPINGVQILDKTRFEEIYDDFWRMAVVITAS